MKNRVYNILLDAGHYGEHNRSSVVPEYYESKQMWLLHLYLKEALTLNYNVNVDITRDEQDKDLSVTKRGKKAKGYDLAISEHSNVSKVSEKTNRVDVYYPFDNINNSVKLASALVKSISECMGVEVGKARTRVGENGKQDYYGFMRGARSVGCPLYYIVENSFHSNKNAAEWLLDQNNLRLLAEVQADTIAELCGLEEKAIRGDVDGDGKITQYDYILAKRIYMGTYQPSAEELKRCDVDGDGKISAQDYIAIKRKYLNGEK